MKLAVSIIVLLTGCCNISIQRPDGTKIVVNNFGTGRRIIVVDGVRISHSEIPETLRAAGGLVGEAAKAAGYGAPVDMPFDPSKVRQIQWKKTHVPLNTPTIAVESPVTDGLQ